MKKKSTSCVRLTGLMANAYAAGSPRTRTKSVEPTLAIAELMKNGGKSPEITSWNSKREGKKKTAGGGLGSGRFVLSASRQIHRNGKTETRTHKPPNTRQTNLGRRETPGRGA